MPSLDPRAQRLATLLRDRYELLEFLGQGGFAAVYKARSRGLDRLEALKVLHATHEDDPEFAGRFQQEARLAAALDHPNIVRIFDFGRAEELYWYSMQLVDGPTFTKLLAGGPLEERRAAALLVPVCDALAYAHEKGIVHRDIKPDNVILGRSGRPILMDFGIAKSENSTVKTQSGLILGSPTFLSPEQVRGEPADGRTDVYALGVSLYLMLSGKRPFAAQDRTQLMLARLREDPIPLEGARPGVDPRIAGLVSRCLSREKEGRPSAAELRDALLGYLDETGGRPLSERLSGEVPLPSAAPATAVTGVTAATAYTEHETPPTAAIPPAPRPVPPPVPQPPPAVSAAPAPRSRLPLAAGLGVTLVVAALVTWRLIPRRPQLPSRSGAPVATPLPAAPAPTAAPVLPTATPAPEPALGARAQEPAPEPPPVRPAPARRIEREAPPVKRVAVVRPEVLEQAPIALPSDLRAEYAGKGMSVEVTIGENGRVKAARVVSPVDPPCAECDAAAVESLKRSRYSPAKDRDGNPVESKFLAGVRF